MTAEIRHLDNVPPASARSLTHLASMHLTTGDAQ
jgi:hypothetical protein